MSRTITISPLTRIEGHLAIRTEGEPRVNEQGKTVYTITDAKCEGEMYRGFERILKGRDPLDSHQITQRICGVCPISHAMASCQAQEMAYGIKPNKNGRILQNLIWAANYLQSHITHFYALSALDFVDVTAVLQYRGRNRSLLQLKAWVEDAVRRSERGLEVFPAAPFLPRYEADYIADPQINCDFIAHYLESLKMRQVAHEMAAVFGARLPHSTAIVPGGCTEVPTMERILSYKGRLDKVGRFIKDVYYWDVIAAAEAFPSYWLMGRAPEHFLAFGVFDLDENGRRLFPAGALVNGKLEAVDEDAITEHVRYAWFSSPSQQHPYVAQTQADPDKQGAYTWGKAPRYKGLPMEVGPLARILIMYHDPAHADVKQEVDQLGIRLEHFNSVLGRHLARAIEARRIVDQCFAWLDELDVDGHPAEPFELPRQAQGRGLVEAPRGALGHWMTIENSLIENYECVVPTTWNCSPKDDNGVHGPMEQALIGLEVSDPDQPMELARVVRSFDPCLACAVH